jgi:hypothetical protein
MALGIPHQHRRFMLMFAACEAILVYPLSIYWGPSGAALSLVLSIAIATIPQLYRIRALLNFRLTSYFRALLPGVLAALAVLAALSGILAVIPRAATNVQ